MIIYDIMPPINRATTDGQIELERAADRLASRAPTPIRIFPGPFFGTSTMVSCCFGGRKFAYSSLNKKRICIPLAIGQRENE
jgi:hypothetical protein